MRALVKNVGIDQLLENFAALFKIFELVKTGTRRRKQHNIPVFGVLHSRFDRLLQRMATYNGESAAEFFFYFIHGLADGQNLLTIFVQERQ